MIENCKKEIITLHRFFEEWFKGNLPDDEKTFSRITGVLCDDFLIVSPDGKITDKSGLTAGLKMAHNRWNTGTIQIKNIKGRNISGDICMLIYEEWQTTPDGTTTRLSSALFQREENAPNGVKWIHLHETWI